MLLSKSPTKLYKKLIETRATQTFVHSDDLDDTYIKLYKKMEASNELYSFAEDLTVGFKRTKINNKDSILLLFKYIYPLTKKKMTNNIINQKVLEILKLLEKSYEIIKGRTIKSVNNKTGQINCYIILFINSEKI